MKITIYLSKKTKDKLLEIQKKYHISLSTIAQEISDYVKPLFSRYGNDIFTEYLEKEHRIQTTIKPNNTNLESEIMNTIQIHGSLKIVSHVLSNILYMYANEMYVDLFLITNTKELEKRLKEINKIFFKKKEERWNDNQQIRTLTRLARKNASYLKRIMA